MSNKKRRTSNTKHREPNVAYSFVIEQKHCDNAARQDPCRCVIAQAINEKEGSGLLEVLVLKTKTKFVYSGDYTCTYRTPKILRDALVHFDETGQWNLPLGVYELLPLKWSETRNEILQREERRRQAGRPKRVYPPKGKNHTPRSMNPRVMNMKELRDGKPCVVQN